VTRQSRLSLAARPRARVPAPLVVAAALGPPSKAAGDLKLTSDEPTSKKNRPGLFHADFRVFVPETSTLAELFHENTKLDAIREGETGLKFTEMFSTPALGAMMSRSFKTSSSFKKIPLPDAAPIDESFTSVTFSRRSVRKYTGAPISLQQLSSLLKHSSGISGGADLVGDVSQTLRVVPSGGALFPIEVYVLAHSVVGLEQDRIFHYLPETHELEFCNQSVSANEAIKALPGANPGWTRDAAALFLVTAVFLRMSYKYGDRGYRVTVAEAGSIGSQLNFAATGLGLGSCQIFGFYDDRVNGWLEIDGCNEAVLVLCAIGQPSKEGNKPENRLLQG
jgi:SagB-type dehydrogenase family enzyme